MSEQSAGGPSLQERQQAIQDKLDSLVGMTHERLSIGALRITVGDQDTALLTYREITARPDATEGLGLVPGAVLCQDEEVGCILAEGHLRTLDEYLQHRRTLPVPAFLGSYGVRELNDPSLAGFLNVSYWDALYPRANGIDWYRGLFLSTAEESAVIIMAPRMQPWKQGGNPMPILYSLGDVPVEDMREVAELYTQYQHAHWDAQTDKRDPYAV